MKEESNLLGLKGTKRKFSSENSFENKSRRTLKSLFVVRIKGWESSDLHQIRSSEYDLTNERRDFELIRREQENYSWYQKEREGTDRKYEV